MKAILNVQTLPPDQFKTRFKIFCDTGLEIILKVCRLRYYKMYKHNNSFKFEITGLKSLEMFYNALHLLTFSTIMQCSFEFIIMSCAHVLILKCFKIILGLSEKSLHLNFFLNNVNDLSFSNAKDEKCQK